MTFSLPSTSCLLKLPNVYQFEGGNPGVDLKQYREGIIPCYYEDVQNTSSPSLEHKRNVLSLKRALIANERSAPRGGSIIEPCAKVSSCRRKNCRVIKRKK